MKRARPSYRDTLLASKRANDMMADLAGKPRLDYGDMIREPVKRAAKQPSAEPLESDVQKAIIHYLKLHQKVAWVARFNSGVMRSEYNGKESFTRFSTQAGLSDVLGMMYGGQLFALEVKRPPFSGPRNSREQAQAQFLGDIRAGGGLAGFATSIEDARAILGI